MSTGSLDERRRIVREHTVESAPALCPELRLHLVTPAQPLWRATDADLERLGFGAPYWAFAWGGGQALARHVLDHRALVRGARVLDFGAGGGVVSIATAVAGASRVVAVDVDPLAEAAVSLNAELNGVEVTARTRDLVGDACDAFDVVLVGDATYEAELTARVVPWLDALSRAGKTVLVADCRRGHLDTSRLERVADYDAPADAGLDGSVVLGISLYRVPAR